MPISKKAEKRPTPCWARWLAELRPYLRQCGDDLRPPWHLGRRRLLDYMAVYIDRGSGWFELGDRGWRVGPGTLFWVPPNVPHAMRGESAEMHCLYAHFDLLYDPERSLWDAFVLGNTEDFGAWRHRLHPPLGDPEIDSWFGVLPVRDTQLELLQIFQALCREFHRDDAYSGGCTGWLFLLLEAIRRGLRPEPENGGGNARLLEAREFIRSNFARRDLTVGWLARHFGLSEAHFRERFREVTGAAPREYLRFCRLEHARELLCYTDLTVGRVAELSGFSSIYDFSRSFRGCFGVPPGTLRRGTLG